MKNADQPIQWNIPLIEKEGENKGNVIYSSGLTKREYIATHEEIPYEFVIDSLSKEIQIDISQVTTKQVLEHRAKLKCQYADELLKQLEK